MTPTEGEIPKNESSRLPLGHRNLMYSMHYTNPTEEEMKEAINSR